MPAPRSCDAPLGAELVEDFSIEIPMEACSDPRTCQYGLVDFDVAPDGNSWVLASTSHVPDESEGELWATHFSSDGELLGSQKVATALSFNGGSVGQTGDLVVDARGHAFVLIYQIDAGPNADAPLAEQSWLTELDAEAEIVNGPTALAGIAAGKLGVRDDGGVVLAASALQHQQYGVVAALTDTGERLWSRVDLRTADFDAPQGTIAGLSASSSGAALVFAMRERLGDNLAYGLTRFDEAGTVTWDVVLDRPMFYAALGSGGDGDALISHGSWMGYVRGDGTAAWTYELPGPLASAAIDAERERVYALRQLTNGETSMDEVFAITELYAISIDGESCERHAVPPGAPATQLHVDAEGRLYVTGEALAFNGQPHLGHLLTRLRLPE